MGLPFEEHAVDVEIISVGVTGSTASVTEHRDIVLRPLRQSSTRVVAAETIFVQDVPDDAKRAFDEALRELDRSRTDEVIRLLTQAVTTFTEYFAALQRLGYEYLKQRNYDYARAVYTKAVSVNEKSFWCWYGLGLAAREQGLHSIALETAERSIAL